MKILPHSISKPLCFISSAFLLLALYPSLSLAGQFKITRVYDGDTVKAIGHDITIKVRLVGIDAPETSHGKRKPGQPYGQRSKEYLAKLILNRTVDVKGYGLGPYNRILGAISINGENINLQMVKAGLAEVYRGKSPHKFGLSSYWQAEREAKKAKKGMWSLGDKYVSPKEWRKMHKGR
jgi:endonuclease YncB( thermonuclease family)